MSSIDHAYEFCEKLAKSHYENFPVGALVPKEHQKYVWAIYAFARTADDFADEGRHSRETNEELQKRLSQLDEWEFKLMKSSRGEADDPIFIALAQTIRDLEIPTQLLKDLLTAYRMDVRQNRYKNFDELFFYCKHSANPVGRLVLHIFGYRDEPLNLLSDKICTALQLTNFWQDIAVDIAKNRIYLPQDEMAKFRVTEGDIHLKICNRAFITLLKYCIDKTAKLFDEGLPLCSQVKKDIKLEMRLTWLGGTTVLKKIARNHYDVFRRRPTIKLLDKAILLTRALMPTALKPIR